MDMMNKVIDFFEDPEADFQAIIRTLSDEDQLEFLECYKIFLENLREQFGLPPNLELVLEVKLPEAIRAAAEVVEAKELHEKAVVKRDEFKANLIAYLKNSSQSEQLAPYREALAHLQLHPEMTNPNLNQDFIKEQIARLELEIINNEKRSTLIAEFQERVEWEQAGTVEDFQNLIDALNPISTPDEQISDWKLLADILRNERKNITPENLAEYDRGLSDLEEHIENCEKFRYEELSVYVDKLIALFAFNKKMRALTKDREFNSDPKRFSNN